MQIKGENMKNIMLAVILVAFSSPTFSNDHKGEGFLHLEKRQADAVMTVTNVDIGDESSTISATGKMGVYGTVYVTYNLTYATRTSGFVTGNGRGALDADNVAAGAFRGVWNREGSIIKIRQIVQISDGTQNLDVIDIDMLKDTFVIKAYTLK
jgi:hypothetical protein|tara:strand:+ start:175 stop:633 length:459 start_codon:yes stop_codon:yes gene_type:complete